MALTRVDAARRRTAEPRVTGLGTRPSPGVSWAEVDDPVLAEAVRRGDETAFAALLERYHNALVELAARHMGDRAAAEEIARATWLDVIEKIERFDGPSLWAWITILARRRAKGSKAPLQVDSGEHGEPAVDPARFLPQTDERWPGEWAVHPSGWHRLPAQRLHADETLQVARRAVEALRPGERGVFVLRDVEGRSPEETSAVLGISTTVQRALLHQARSAVHRALERHLDEQRRVGG